MADHYQLRPTVEADIAQLGMLELSSFSDPWTEDQIRETVTNRTAVSLVAEKDKGSVVGVVIARLVADEAEILSIAVDPDHRRIGIGAQLLQALLQKLRLKGAASVWLEVRPSNLAGQGLYHSFGFVSVGVRRRYYRHPTEDALILAHHFDASRGTASQ